MGFCLFPDPQAAWLYFAVNPAHVEEVQAQGDGACLLKFPFDTGSFVPLVKASPEAVNEILRAASKIGLEKAEIRIVGGQKNNRRPAPLLLNQTDRVALAREMMPEELAGQEADFPTASEFFLGNGTKKMMVERPGVFASLVNAGGKVPVLQALP